MTNLNPRSLSVEEMLEHLRRQAQFARSVSRLNAFGSTMNLGPDEESPSLAERFLDRSAVNIREAEALETAAKVLEVLAHDGFSRAVRSESNVAVRAVIHKTPSSASLTDFWGEDPIAALLKAHEALFPPPPPPFDPERNTVHDIEVEASVFTYLDGTSPLVPDLKPGDEPFASGDRLVLHEVRDGTRTGETKTFAIQGVKPHPERADRIFLYVRSVPPPQARSEYLMGEAKASMAEQLADDDAGVCSEPSCYKPAAVIAGPDATELCTEHAADLVQQLMALPKVRAALEARSREGK